MWMLALCEPIELAVNMIMYNVSHYQAQNANDQE